MGLDIVKSSSSVSGVSCGGGLDLEADGLDLSTNAQPPNFVNKQVSCGGGLDHVSGGLQESCIFSC